MTSSTHPQKNCFHCGLEVPEHLHLTVRFEDEEHETCCAGCQAVAQSIIDAGLGNYYKQRTADAEKSELPPPEVLSQLKLYDLPEVQADFVEVGAGDEREAVLMLGGITCAACVWLIEQQLLRMKGVVRVDLNYSTHRCRVVWDGAHIELSDILLKIRQTGYTAAPYDAQKIEAQAQKERKQFIVRLAVAGLGMMQTMMFALPTYFYGGDIEPLYLEILHWGGFLMVLPVVFYSALPFYRGAWRDWKNRRVGMDTPIAIAIVMTFIAGIYSLATNAGQGMYFESIAMLLFFLLGGRFMEQIARRKAGDAAERLVKLVPAFCHRLPAYPESEAIEEAAVVRLNIGGGGTACSAPLAMLNREKADVDLVVIVSDNESWADDNQGWGATTSLLKEWDILKRRCPEAKLVCLDIQPYTKAQARNRHDILNIGGFSDQVFSLIGSFAERGMGTDFWVEEIEKTPLAVVN